MPYMVWKMTKCQFPKLICFFFNPRPKHDDEDCSPHH